VTNEEITQAEIAEARERLTEIMKVLNELQMQYDSQLLSAAVLAYAADMHSMLLNAKVVTPQYVAANFAAALRSAFVPGEAPKIVYGDQLSGGLQ
jgi:hypothetical protein